METVYVKGNVEVIYFMREDQKPPTDMNHTQCAEMKILLKKNEIDKIKLNNKPTASLKPTIEVNEVDKKLSQFNWDTQKRPQSFEDLVD